VHQKQKILLIDRNQASEKFLSDAFKQKGYSVVRISSGENALKLFDQINPTLVFSELKTDDLDGTQIFYHLKNQKSHSNHAQVPFVFYSESQIQEPLAKKLFDDGLTGWYSKSIHAEELNQIVDNLVLSHNVRKRTQELQQEVRRSEFWYRDQLENANDFIFTLDDQGNFIYLNNRFTPLTGFGKETWLGKKFIALIDHKDQEIVEEHYQVIHQGRARVFEAQITGKHTLRHMLSFSITPIFEKGSIVGAMGIGRDITDQKKMENEIITLKNFNESIIQSMEAGLLTVNLSGSITSINTGGCNILGMQEKDLIGKKLSSVLRPEEVTVILSKPRSPKSLRYSREMELTIRSGEKICIGFTATDRSDNQGNKVGTIVSFRDITQLKQMQSEVIRMDRLASLGVLASGIAHEIKNPLAGIKTLAQACMEEFEDRDPKIEYLTRIINQVNRLNDLLKTFFAYARPKPPDKKHHSFAAILGEVIHLVSKRMENTGILYKETIEEELPDVYIDSQQIQQVLLNLVLNAIDAMPEGGNLEVIARPLSVNNYKTRSPHSKKAGRRPVESIEICIRDSGIGIDKYKLEEIFNPFFTTKPSGLGLGLSIVHRIIEEHQGEIRVQSELGQGTSFRLTLHTGEKK